MSENPSVAGAAGFTAVINQWRDGVPPLGSLREPSLRRFSHALADSRASVVDRVVLLRQVLRYESLRLGQQASAPIDQALEQVALASGLEIVGRGAGKLNVSARAWRPVWLEDGRHSVDEIAMHAQPRRFGARNVPRPDPFLQSTGYTSYRSSAQAAAIRSVLSMPAGAALAVDLPTGEGKSTVFKVIAKVGFAASPSGQVPGLVVVVVPTVTLALDHERTCGGNDAAPLAYIGGREGRNELIRSAIESGTQRILFAAPESIAQSLRLPLARAASAGRLGAVVIDEAHLVDAWGTGFRTEFQTLAGLLNAWKAESPQAFEFRTVFLSATLTDASLQTLQDLFSPEVPIPVFSGASVRPEPEYWVASPVDSATRRERVDEALRHLPRPLILYVTKVADAEMWHERLRGQGYSRVAMVHGGTSSDERERVLRGWTEAAIDVVVATSAFGLGIDYPHVRSVVHACLPETFDRFYQEVGRAGRDGCASISLLVPDFNDAQIARSLSAQKVITVERGLVRWRSMFQHPLTISEGYPRYVVPLDVPPGYDINDIDLVGERSTDWNQRTLALMARAGLIRLLGACARQLDPQSSPQQFERIEIRNEKHLHMETWQEVVEPTRLQIMEKSYEAFVLLKRFGTGHECPATLVGEMYSGPGRQVALRCSGCRVCREDPKSRIEDGSIAYKRPPWPIQAQLAPSLKTVWGDAGYAVVTYPTRLTSVRAVRDFVDGLRRLDTFGMRIWVAVGDTPEWMLSSVDKACAGKPWVTLSSNSWAPMIWPEGAQIVACSVDAVPDASMLAAGASKHPRIVLVPDGARDPLQPSREFVAIVPGPTYRFESFLMAILQ